jgi:hypothetical protein
LVNIVGLKHSKISDQSFWFVGQLASFYKSKEPSHYVADKRGLDVTAYYSHEAPQSFIFQDALINEIFSRFSSSSDGYALNRYLIEAISAKLSGSPTFSGVVYQSTKDAPGINFAIFGEAIQQLETGQLNLVQVTDIDDFGTVVTGQLKADSCGRVKCGHLRWA